MMQRVFKLLQKLLLFLFFSLSTVVSFQCLNSIRQRSRLPWRHNAAVSWTDLAHELATSASQPVSIDSLREDAQSTPTWSQDHPTFIRERERWCPYSERVWLALEHLNVPYDTVRIDNSGYGPRPSYYSGQTPQIRWPGETKTQSESMDLVYNIYEQYGQENRSGRHDTCIKAWRTIMPARSRPSSRAAFLFQYNGEPLWRSVLEDSLVGVDALLGEQGGPFFAGDVMGPADICWCPFLERYRYQLPCLHDGLNPNDPGTYPNLARWYAAMDTVPAYICHVKGNAASWRKVLCMAGFGNAGAPPTIQANMDKLVEKEKEESLALVADGETIWRQYASTRPYAALTPPQEAARIILQNRQAIARDTMKRDNWESNESLDEAMKDLVRALSSPTTASASARALARFLTERMCVPRDMGCLPAAYIHVIGFN